MYIPNYHNLWLERLDIQLNDTTIQKNQSKSPKLLSQRIRKRYYKTLEASVQPNVPFLPDNL